MSECPEGAFVEKSEAEKLIAEARPVSENVKAASVAFGAVDRSPDITPNPHPCRDGSRLQTFTLRGEKSQA